jgi:hypothetical protein
MIDGSVSDIVVPPFLKQLFGSVLFGSEIRLHVPESKEYNKQFISGLTRNHELTNDASKFIKKIDELTTLLTDFTTKFDTELTKYCNETTPSANSRILIHKKGQSTSINSTTLFSDIKNYLNSGSLHTSPNDIDVKEFTERFMMGNSTVVFYAFNIMKMLEEIKALTGNSFNTTAVGAINTELDRIIAECDKYINVFNDETYLGFEGKSAAFLVRERTFDTALTAEKSMIDNTLNHDYNRPLAVTNTVTVNGTNKTITDAVKNALISSSRTMYGNLTAFLTEVGKFPIGLTAYGNLKNRVDEIDAEAKIIEADFKLIANDQSIAIATEEQNIAVFSSLITKYFAFYDDKEPDVLLRLDRWQLLNDAKANNLTGGGLDAVRYIRDGTADELWNGTNVTGKYVDNSDVRNSGNAQITPGDSKWSSLVPTVLGNNNAGNDFDKLYNMFIKYANKQISDNNNR